MAEAAANNVVMVIEDTSEAQELLREALVDKGIGAACHNGEAALEALDAVQPGVITLCFELAGNCVA